MIVRPYITPGNIVVYSPPGRDDVEITVTCLSPDRGHWVVVKYADGKSESVRAARIKPMPAERMQPVASIVQLDDVIAEYEAMDGDIGAADRLKRKYGIR